MIHEHWQPSVFSTIKIEYDEISKLFLDCLKYFFVLIGYYYLLLHKIFYN